MSTMSVMGLRVSEISRDEVEVMRRGRSTSCTRVQEETEVNISTPKVTWGLLIYPCYM